MRERCESAALPRSLMLRLERMAQGQTWEAAGEGLEHQLEPPNRQGSPAAFFGLGVFAATAVAGLLFLGITTFEVGEAEVVRNPRLPIAIAGHAAASAVQAAAELAEPAVFDVSIDRR